MAHEPSCSSSKPETLALPESPTIIVVGTTSYDWIGTASNEALGNARTVALTTLSTGYGGRGANFAVHAAAMGAHPLLLSYGGTDFIDYQAKLIADGVDLTGTFVSQSHLTPRSFIFNAPHSVYVFFFDALTDVDYTTRYRKLALERVRNTPVDAIYCTSDLQDLNYECLTLSKARVRVYAPGHNTANYCASDHAKCLEQADIVIVNSDEALNITALLNSSINKLLARYSLSIFLETQGNKGSIVHTERGRAELGACQPTQVVDETGAGDAFAAAFVTEYTRSENVIRSAKLANALGSFAVEHPTCQFPAPSPRDLIRRVVTRYGSF